jgi:hypothetical protein
MVRLQQRLHGNAYICVLGKFDTELVALSLRQFGDRSHRSRFVDSRDHSEFGRVELASSTCPADYWGRNAPDAPVMVKIDEHYA